MSLEAGKREGRREKREERREKREERREKREERREKRDQVKQTRFSSPAKHGVAWHGMACRALL